MALTQLTKIDGRGINTTSDYRVGILTAIKFVGPFDGTGGNFAGVVTATDGVFSGNVTIGGTLTYEDVTNIDSVGIITAQKDIHVGAGVSAVGVGTFGGGIFIDDSITHIGDPNTKIRFPSADNIRFEVGGTQAVHVLPESAGSGGPRIGLNINNPTGMLHIYGANPPVRIQNSNDSANLQFGMWDGSHIMFQASNRTLKFATETTDHMVFNTGGLAGSYERLRITSGGTVNIGGNYSHTGSKFQVTGNSTFTGNIDANGDIDVDGHTNLDNVSIAGVTTCGRIDTNTINVSADNDIRFASGNWSGNTTKIQNHNNYLYLVAPSNGFQFRIGATDLWLMDSISNDGNFWPTVDSGRDIGKSNRRIRNLYATTLYGDGSQLTGIVADKIFEGNTEVETVDTGSDGHIKFTTEGSEIARILANGNIGIGEDVPVAKVHIAGSNYVSVGGGGFDSNVVLAITRNFATGHSAGLALNSGTNATSFIHLGDADDPDIGKITYDHANNSMSFTSNAAERLRIDNAGRLSLGVSASPGSYPVGSQARQVQAEIKGGISGNNYHHGSLALNCTNNNSNLHLVRSDTNQSANVGLGNISFSGYDGSDFHVAAQISGIRDAAGGNNDVPGRLVFLTTADGASQPTERLRINSSGQVSLGNNPTVASDAALHIELDGSREYLRLNADAGNNNAYIEIQADDNRRKALIFKSGGTRRGVIGVGDSDEAANATSLFFSASSNIAGNSPHMVITSGGTVNIGGDYTQTTYTMKVTGSFAATTKSFVIDHPTKENHSLRYACLEGPENSVYVRGKTSESVIELPDYWKGLVHEDSITVNVTPIGNHKVWVEAINNNSVTIGSDGSEYFYTVFAERKDVDKLEVEVAK